MGYCKKRLLQGALLRGILPFLLGCWCLGMGLHWEEKQADLNAVYLKQAQELSLDAPLVKVESKGAELLFYIGFAFFFVIICVLFIPFFRPWRSKFAKSVMRYDKYLGEGDVRLILDEVDADVGHAPTFGSISVGEEWIVGRTNMVSYGAVRRDAICGVFYFYVKKRGRGASGVPTSSKEYALVLIDAKFRDTIFLSVREKHVMGAYRMLLRHQKSMVHGNLDDYLEFLSMDQDERERTLYKIERENDTKKYWKS